MRGIGCIGSDGYGYGYKAWRGMLGGVHGARQRRYGRSWEP